jgi:pSer/pThr/pTyr-binding forkhead associated (FHA) protein
MPLIRCPKCGQAYDVPGVIAVRLSNSIAACHCGEWISGSKAAVLARMLNPAEIKQIDLQPYLANAPVEPEALPSFAPSSPAASEPRSLLVVAPTSRAGVNGVFTIHEHPLWIGRRGCHVEFDEADLSIRHCSISVRGDQLILRDAESHTGTFLDGEDVDEAVISDGPHVIRVGGALITVESTSQPGTPVEHLAVPDATLDDERMVRALMAKKSADLPKRAILVCIDGSLNGQEFEIPPAGLIVGREGHVRVPDEFLSRKHFEVGPDQEGAIRVRDLGSRNGTFLNTLPAQNTKVQAGDEIRAGVNRFRIDLRS